MMISEVGFYLKNNSYKLWEVKHEILLPNLNVEAIILLIVRNSSHSRKIRINFKVRIVSTLLIYYKVSSFFIYLSVWTTPE